MPLSDNYQDVPISSDTKAGIFQADEHVVETANNTIYKFREDFTSFIAWHDMTCLKVFFVWIIC